MKIAYLSASKIPSRTANSIHVMKMCQAFAKNGHEVVLFARKSKEQVDDEYQYYGVDHCFNIVKQIWPPLRGMGGWLYALQKRRKVLQHPLPDIFYGRDLYSLLAVTSIGRPLIYEAHTPPANWVRHYLEDRLLSSKNFERLVVISNALKKEYLTIFPWIGEENVLVAHDGADLADFSNKEISDFTLRSRGRRLKVGYVGQLYPGKGMEIISQLAKLLPDFDFHVVGGAQEDVKLWKAHINVKNVCFHGFVSHSLLKRYYNSFDVLLAPYQNRVAAHGGKGDISRWMSPLKIFEYMAARKPIVASNLPVLKEILEHKVNALLCSPGKVEEWANAILVLRKNDELRSKIIKNAYMDVKEKFVWEKRAANVTKF